MTTSKTLHRYALFALVSSLLWAFLIAVDWIPQLRGDYGWRWPYAVLDNPARLLPLLVAAVIYVVVAAYLLRQRDPFFLLIFSLAGGVVLTLATLFVTHDDLHFALYTRTLSSGTTGWHHAAVQMNDQGGADEVLAEWPEFMREQEGVSAHVAISPPGMALVYSAANQALAGTGVADELGPTLRAEQCHEFRFFYYSNAEFTSTWLGVLMPFWGALAVFPLYWLGRRLYHERAARWSVLWWPIIPSFLMFTPYPSTFYPVLGMLSFALLVEGLLRKNAAWIIAAGFVMSVSTFMNFSILPLLFLAGVFTLGIYYLWRKEKNLRWHWPFRVGIWYAVGLASIWLIYTLTSGVFIWEIFESAMDHHLNLDRPYLPWLVLHVYDFIIFTGWPLMLLAGLAFWRLVRRRKEFAPGHVLALSALVTVIVLNISGIARGETGRVWLFLAPFFLLAAADVLKNEETSPTAYVFTIAQVAVLLVMVAFLRVIDSGLTEAPNSAPTSAAMPRTDYLPNGATFDDIFQLNAFAGHVEDSAEPVLHLWLEWESDGQVEHPYEISLLPIFFPEDGSEPITAPAILTQPFNKEYPTTCWLPESNVMTDYFTIPVPSIGQPGTWWVSVSMFDLDPQTREGIPIAAKEPDGSPAQNNQVGIGPFFIMSSE